MSIKIFCPVGLSVPRYGVSLLAKPLNSFLMCSMSKIQRPPTKTRHATILQMVGTLCSVIVRTLWRGFSPFGKPWDWQVSPTLLTWARCHLSPSHSCEPACHTSCWQVHFLSPGRYGWASPHWKTWDFMFIPLRSAAYYSRHSVELRNLCGFLYILFQDGNGGVRLFAVKRALVCWTRHHCLTGLTLVVVPVFFPLALSLALLKKEK